MQWKIQLSELNYDDNEKKAIERVLLREWLTMGDESDNFEAEFQEFLGHQNRGIFVSSATAGLHLILMALGLEHDDEVIIPALTFVSDANVVLHCGGKVVFADSQSLTNFNVSEDDVIAKINDKTKAIILVHFAGFPMNFDLLKSICAKKEIPIIEDCAHAPGASLDAKMCGTLGDFAFFSFFSNKNLAVGEGGMVFAKDEMMSNKIRLMRSHGMDRVTIDRHLGRANSYDIIVPGLNYRADEMRAAIGREQLKKLREGNEKRKRLHAAYVENFKNTEILTAFEVSISDEISAYHIMPILLPKLTDRHKIISGMRKKSIQTSIHYPNFKEFSAFASMTKFNHSPIVDEICTRELTLPLHPRMTMVDVKEVSNTLLGLI